MNNRRKYYEKYKTLKLIKTWKQELETLLKTKRCLEFSFVMDHRTYFSIFYDILKWSHKISMCFLFNKEEFVKFLKSNQLILFRLIY